MYAFNGNFRRMPIQSLGGNSVETNRIELIKKAQDERKKREELRLKEESCFKIQKVVKSFYQRQLVKRQERLNYENYYKTNGLKNFQDLEFLLKRLLHYYELRDSDKLISICQFIIKNIDKLFAILLQNNNENNFDKQQWQFRIQKLLTICLKQIFATSSKTIPLRTIETFTSYESIRKFAPAAIDEETILNFSKRLFSYMIDQNYYQNVRKMLNEKIDENTYDEITTTPRTEISKVILDMITRPLNLVFSSNQDENFDYKILASFNNEILASDSNHTIINFIIPSLASRVNFPFIKLIKFLYVVHLKRNVASNNNQGERNSMFKDLKISGYLLYAILQLDGNFLDEIIAHNHLQHYLIVIGSMINCISKLPKSNEYKFNNYDDDEDISNNPTNSDEDDDDDDDIQYDVEMQPQFERLILMSIINQLNEENRVNAIVKNIDSILHLPNVIHSVCIIAHNLMIYNRAAISEYRLLDLLAFKPEFIRTLWYILLTTKSEKNNHCISILSKGITIPPNESAHIVPILSTFCALFGRVLSTLHDGEFYYCSFDKDQQLSHIDEALNIEQIENQVMPFHIKDIVHMCVSLKELSIGLVEIAFPETRSAIRDHYRNILLGKDDEDHNSARMNQEKAVWSQLLKVCVSLLRQLHTRDLRCEFCPPDNWIAPTLNIPLDRPNDLTFSRRRPRPFQPIRDFTRKNIDEGPPISTKQIRSITILKEIPFVVPFNKRFEVLQGLLAAEKLRSQGDMQGFLQGPQTHLTVRRTHLYEDAFDKLSLDNEPNLRTRFRVQMINEQGLSEAGIDGGGIFREFLSELIKTAFDPNRGFFILTKDNMLYPNPSASIIQENYKKHYYFIGRMLGKALFENLLVELPLAEFFLSKLAGRHADIIDIHQLASLDPDMHKNLMKLKSYSENEFKELGLDFTVVCDDMGETRIVELKPDGASITVNSSNWIEYIQVMADFKLNRQIQEQCYAFRQGLGNVLPISWLYMFNTKELQVLISGAEVDIDVDDLIIHTRYGGDYNSEHDTIKMFWNVVRSFDDLQRRQLLKFVTSCSRPPLLGFKDLDPPFCIQNAGDDAERLASASTCMNLLKLPTYADENTMREKLLYSIQSGVGFELS